MNDTKYSPAAAETEELMDGSLHSVVSYIVQLVKSWNLNQLHCVLAIRRQLAFFADQSQWPDVHLAVCACRSFAALDVREEGEDRIFHHGFYIFPV